MSSEPRATSASALADDIEKNGLCNDPLWPKETRDLIVQALRSFASSESTDKTIGQRLREKGFAEVPSLPSAVAGTDALADMIFGCLELRIVHQGGFVQKMKHADIERIVAALRASAPSSAARTAPLGAPTEMPPLPSHHVCGENGALHVHHTDYDKLRAYARRLEASAAPAAALTGETPLTDALDHRLEGDDRSDYLELLEHARHLERSARSANAMTSEDAACKVAANLLRNEIVRLEYPKSMFPQEAEKIGRRQTAFQAAILFLDPEPNASDSKAEGQS